MPTAHVTTSAVRRRGLVSQTLTFTTTVFVLDGMPSQM